MSIPLVFDAPPGGVLAYDPGVSTGWAYALVVDGPRGQDVDVLQVGQGKYGSHVDTARFLASLAEGLRPEHVVAERFDLRPGNKFLADLTPVKVNAIADYLVGDVTYQTPAQAKTFCPDTRLKHLGYWPTGRTVGCPDADDARDALRHLIRFCAVGLRLPGLLARVSE